MIFLNQIFLAMMLTGVTGTFALWLWDVSKKKLAKMHPDLVYLMLRCVCILYVFPIGYLLLMCTVRSSYMQFDGFWKRQMVLTGYMGSLFSLMQISWFVLVAYKFIRHRKHRGKNEAKRQKGVQKYNVSVNDRCMLEILDDVKEEIGIRGKIGLYENEFIQSPMMTGIFRPKLLLPKQNYTREQLRVVFYHECMHCKSYDLAYKLIAVYVDTLFPFNSCANVMRRFLDEWSEYYCDRRVLAALDREVGVREYFGIIVEVMKEEPEPYGDEAVFSALSESKWRLERRIEYMARNKNMGLVKKSMMAAATVGMLLITVAPIYAAGATVATVNDELQHIAQEKMVRQESQTELQEYVIPAGKDNTYTSLVLEEPGTEAMPYLDENVLKNFNWTITAGMRHGSAMFYAREGQVVSTSASVTPNGQTFWLGVMKEDDLSARYVAGTESLSYNFTIEETSFYRVFVQNRGTQTISAAGYYYIYTPNATE